jgi:RNA polymerase sigma-70 factor (ECF subfamily)
MKAADKHQLKSLLARAQSGDAGAWNEFFGRVRKLLHAEVGKLLGPGGQGPLDRSAVVQSALGRIWERIGEQFPDGPEDAALRRFIAWVKAIVRNRTWDEWRKWKRRPAVEAGPALAGVADPGPRGQAQQRDRVAAGLAAALAELPERDRQVVTLFWFEGLPDAAIGERLGCSVGAVRVLRCRALRKLQSPQLHSLLEEAHDGRR